MRNLYVRLPEAAVDSLRELGRREMRDPKQQAAALILDGLRRAGLPVEAETRDRPMLTKAAER
jgi:hypothetical protein